MQHYIIMDTEKRGLHFWTIQKQSRAIIQHNSCNCEMFSVLFDKV